MGHAVSITSGISLYVFPLIFLPFFFLLVPPHCLKKKATSAFLHWALISITHSFFIGLGDLPLSPPTITQSIPFTFMFGNSPSKGSQLKNFVLAFVCISKSIRFIVFSFSTEPPIQILCAHSSQPSLS